MFVFIKKIFYIGSLFLSSLVSTTSLNCISMKNQECKVRPEIINVNSNEPIFYPFSIRTSKCSGCCFLPTILPASNPSKRTLLCLSPTLRLLFQCNVDVKLIQTYLH